MLHDHGNRGALEFAHEAAKVETQTANGDLQDSLAVNALLTAHDMTVATTKLKRLALQLGVGPWIGPANLTRWLSDGHVAEQGRGKSADRAPALLVENSPIEHNLVTHKRCSFYLESGAARTLSWCISKAYRAWTVREPHSALLKLAWSVSENAHLLVQHCNDDTRYPVLPEPPHSIQNPRLFDAALAVT